MTTNKNNVLKKWFLEVGKMNPTVWVYTQTTNAQNNI